MAKAFRVRAFLLALVLMGTALAGCTVPWSPEGKNQRSGPGDLALDYIKDSPYTKIHIVIEAVEGYGPNLESLNVLKSTASSLLGKQVTHSLKTGVPGKGKEHVYTIQDVNAIEKERRTEYSSGDTAILYMLYLDGKLKTERDNGGCVLGAAYHGSSIVMFKECVRTAVKQNQGILGPNGSALEHIIERAVLVHEFGHILGLVDNGIPMQKDRLDRDPNHTPKHSKNKDSVMYWAVETSSGIAGILQLTSNTNVPYQFDADDKADIAAAKKGG